MIDRATFERSLAESAPPAEAPPPLAALWWLRNDDWNRAHSIAQDVPGAGGAAVHALLHRIEGDLPNAAYWYDRAGRPPATGSTDDEWHALVDALLEGS